MVGQCGKGGFIRRSEQAIESWFDEEATEIGLDDQASEIGFDEHARDTGRVFLLLGERQQKSFQLRLPS